MASTSPRFIDWINLSEDPKKKDIFFLGAAENRITFYSQQVRALRLVHALAEIGRLKATDRVAVVGAGAAGITAAIALAAFGARVELIEQSNHVLHLQSASPRLLHPNIYNWPELGSLQPNAGLPFLDWTNATGKIVRDKLTQEFKAALAGGAKLAFKPNHLLKAIARNGNQWGLTLAHDGVEDSHDFEKVVLAMGFGDERPLGDAPAIDYWKHTGIGSASLEVSSTAYLVSGNGDGGLTDLMALLVDAFDHVAFTSEFLSLFPQPELAQVVMDAENSVAPGDDLEPAFVEKVLPILRRRGVVDYLTARLRKDRSITFNADGPTLARGKAARLNQVMAFAVLEAAKKAPLNIARSLGKVANVTKHNGTFNVVGPLGAGAALNDPFDTVILRHGPNRLQRYDNVSTYYSGYRTHVEKLLTSTPNLSEPPRLHPATFAYFEPLFSGAFLDHQSQQSRLALAQIRNSTVLIRWDQAAHIATQQGPQDLATIARECERLSAPITLQFDASPAHLEPHAEVIARLARASGGKLKLTSGVNYALDWAVVDSAIPVGAALTSPEQISGLPAIDLLWAALDQSLLRHVDAGLQTVIVTSACAAIGPIHSDIVAMLSPTWTAWRTVIDASPEMLRDFLKLLVRVEQAGPERWDGDQACLQYLVAALVLMLATHAGEPLLPSRCTPGNLTFGGNAVGLGSGCDRVHSKPIADMQNPELWNVDALILSGANEEMFADAGLIRDGGVTPLTLLRPVRVPPVVVQNTRVWRERLAAGPAQWTPAVLKEFAKWRKRQDAQLKASP